MMDTQFGRAPAGQALAASGQASVPCLDPPGFDPSRKDFTIADVLAWARTKPADEGYDFCLPYGCAVAQFGQETGRTYLLGVADLRNISFELWQAAIGDGDKFSSQDSDFTFGKFAKRLEAFLPAEPVTDTWTKADAYMADIELASA